MCAAPSACVRPAPAVHSCVSRLHGCVALTSATAMATLGPGHASWDGRQTPGPATRPHIARPLACDAACHPLPTNTSSPTLRPPLPPTATPPPNLCRAVPKLP
eukprot:286053-Chlamydomonas_euryale.AAC.1